MVGELPSPDGLPTAALREGDAIAIAGPFAPALAGSQLAKLRGELGPGLGGFDIGLVKAAIAAVREAVRGGLLHTAHDVSDGGLACALAEAAIAGGVGLQVDLGPLIGAADPEAWLFGEGPGGFVIAGDPVALERRVEAATAWVVGGARGTSIAIDAGRLRVEVPVDDAAAAWQSLGALMEATPA
jgi:phosphoribosylformylglycinamidine synthase